MAEKVRTKRPKRIPLGTRNVLTAPKREGYVRRFVNADGNRIKELEDAGYSIVRGDVEVGDPKAGKAKPTGSVVETPVGGGTDSVLMEIREDWYEEDQKARQEKIDVAERDMKRQLNKTGGGNYGSVDFQ